MRNAIGILIFICICVSWSIAGETADPVMKYYLDGTNEKLSENILFVDYITVEATAVSYYQNIDYRGKVDTSDTAKYEIEMKEGRARVVQVIDSAGLESNVIPSDLKFVKPWGRDCFFYFFPNDTGAGDMSIGFDPSRPDSGYSPSGIMVIDRDSFELKELFEHFRQLDGFERYSIVYKFQEFEFGTAPVKITIQGTRAGTFIRQYFRQDIYLSDYNFR